MTTCTLGSCSAMSAETDIDVLLCYYNALIDKLNSSRATDNDRTCIATLAAQINSTLRSNINSISGTTRSTVDAPEVDNELMKLLGNQDTEDSNVLKNMYKSNMIIYFIVFLILFILYILI